jgi:hypothetical protein
MYLRFFQRRVSEEWGPFDELLQQAVDENAMKLGEAEGYEKHLAVRFVHISQPDGASAAASRG